MGGEPTHSYAQGCPEKELYKLKLILPSQPLYFYVFGETEQEAFSWYILWYIQKEFWEQLSCAVESVFPQQGALPFHALDQSASSGKG